MSISVRHDSGSVNRLIASIAVIACMLAVAPEAAAAVVAAAGDQFRSEMFREAVGLFWLGAEVAILFCMTAARRIFSERPVPARVALTPRERRRAILWCGAFLALGAVVFGRHLVVTPLPEAYYGLAGTPGEMRAAAEQIYYARTHTHIAVWCAFIAGWVVLEVAIVVQGVRAYRALARLVHGHE